MSLDTVVEDIREEARARAEEIREEADERAEEITDAAEEEAQQIREQRADEVERTVEQEREQRLSSANLEAKQARLEARRDVLADIHDDVEAELAALDGERREDLTRALLETALAEFDDGGDLEVYGRADDADLLAGLAAEYDGATHAGDHGCLGGVVVESSGSRVRVNNTFDSVLEDVWEDNLREISDSLFGDQ